MSNIAKIRKKYRALRRVLNERTRRLWAAAEAEGLGWGGITAVAKATGIARATIERGIRELRNMIKRKEPKPGSQYVRRPGGGRKPLTDHDPTLIQDLEALVEPVTRGNPQSPLRWTCKSTAKLAAELNRKKYRARARTVYSLLRQLNYSLQSNRKTKEGDHHPDRNAQFEHINAKIIDFQKRDQPAISVDAKKKELIGEFRNGGQEWRPKGKPEKVRVQDFPGPNLGKAIPYGVYDVTANQGWVSVGTNHDTAEFAVATIRRWWRQRGCKLYPKADELLITADGGGSNGSRSRLWKPVNIGSRTTGFPKLWVCDDPSSSRLIVHSPLYLLAHSVSFCCFVKELFSTHLYGSTCADTGRGAQRVGRRRRRGRRHHAGSGPPGLLVL